MTIAKKITMLRAMMDGAKGDEDDVLEVFLTLAAGAIFNRMYPYKTDYSGMEVPERYVPIQLKAACYWLNKRGAEGEIQHIENGIHRNYGAADLPDGMLKDVVPFCQAIR